ncbi:MAG: FtsH protease activity modulator HflK [Acidobacteria bacterium]|nr:MAG: FtsH protease activity modulator HflK [Acidobacteriota bacterium]
MSQGFSDQINLPRLEPPKIPQGMIRLAFGVVLAVLLISSTIYQIDPEEVGVVLRFGEYVGDAEPGLHFKLPLGIDKVYKVPVLRELNDEFGFRSTGSSPRRASLREDPRKEAQMLTGDRNAAVVHWVVQYRISDAFDYLFQVDDVQETFRDMAEAVMREVVGDHTINEVLTTGRQQIAEEAEAKLEQLCQDYRTGIQIERVALQDVNPPDEVRAAFDEVNQAKQERETLINQAQSERNKVIPRARGEAQQTISAAEGYALDRVNRALGEAARFESLYAEYRKAPQVTRQRLYLETMQEVMPKSGRKFIVDGDLSGIVPLLDLGRAASSATKAGGGN